MHSEQEGCACHQPAAAAAASGSDLNDAERLTALAQEARLLEFGLEGEGDAARGLASQLEGALTSAMDADSAEELTRARDAIDRALRALTGEGMRLSAHLTDMEIDGVLGMARMPVLTAVLSA